MSTGQDLVARGRDHVGERYILGATVPLGNGGWKGPWDCAEFVSWCVYHVHSILFAVRPPNINRGESYSGWWYEDAVSTGSVVPVARALATPGAVLVRKPGAFGIKIGHVAISLGNGSTVEAHSSKVGVAVLPGAAGRKWSAGVMFKGVDYGAAPTPVPYQPPANILSLEHPYLRGPAVEAVQRALAATGIDPGDIDGIFGPDTHRAVAAYQAREGLLVDGEVGHDTATELGLGWPIRTD